MAKASNPDSTLQAEQFQQLITEHQPALRRFIFALVPDPVDVEEILQETNLAMCRSADSFAMNTNFRAWAMKTAYHRVLEHRKRNRRKPLPFSNDVVETLANDAARHNEELERRSAMLVTCLDRLRPGERQLIDFHYHEGLSGTAIAARLGKSVASIYMSLSRIRKTLLRCISEQASSDLGGSVS